MYNVIENWLPKELNENMIEVMTSDWFPWFYHDYVATQKEKSGDEYYFTHTFFDDVKKEINSGFYEDLISPVLFLIGNNLPLIRAKANLYLNQGFGVKEHAEHTDYPFKHKGALYSLNTCDGYTKIGEEKIPSVANRIIFFDPSVPHCSTSCSDSKTRMNININYF